MQRERQNSREFVRNLVEEHQPEQDILAGRDSLVGRDIPVGRDNLAEREEHPAGPDILAVEGEHPAGRDNLVVEGSRVGEREDSQLRGVIAHSLVGEDTQVGVHRILVDHLVIGRNPAVVGILVVAEGMLRVAGEGNRAVGAGMHPRLGDVVNTASRMESTSTPNRVQCTKETAELLRKQCPKLEVESRGKIDVKGKGDLETFFVNRPKDVLELCTLLW